MKQKSIEKLQRVSLVASSFMLGQSIFLCDAFSKAEGAVEGLTEKMLGFCTGPLFKLTLACLGLLLLITKNEKKVEGLWEWGKRLLMAEAVLVAIDAVIGFIKWIAGLFSV